MTSWELIEALSGKRIKSARLIPSKDTGLDPSGDGEHLELVLETGFTVQLPYRDAVMSTASASEPRDSTES